MADARGTYTGPAERGLATVLPASPNYAAYAQQAALFKQRQEMANQKRMDRLNEQTYKLIDKPWTTAQLWQPDLDKKASDYRNKISDLIYQGKSTEAFSLANMAAQDLASFSTSAKQFSEVLNELNNPKTGKYQLINTEELKKAVAASLRDEKGNLVDPREVNPEKYTLDEWVFNREDGGRFINATEALNRVLDSENLKASVVELSTLGKPVNLGGGLQAVDETTTSYNVQPFAELDPVTGRVQVRDSKSLLDSGLANVFLDDKFLARAVETNVDQYVRETGELPKEASPRVANLYRSMALRGLLEGTDIGGIAKKDTRQIIRNVPRPRTASSGKMTASQEAFLGAEKWARDFFSGESEKINKALEFGRARGKAEQLLPPGYELSPNEQIERVEATDDALLFKIQPYGRSGRPVMDASGNLQYRILSIPISDIDEEAAKNFYANAAYKRHYGTTERGDEQPPVVKPKW